MGAPVVDIILATNRLSPYLAATVASVQAQTWTSWRLTIVDDGSPSPDEIEAVARSVDGARVMRGPASGVSAARNVGIRGTVGELLVFLDDDDLWDPEKLATQVRALQANPDAIAAYTGGYHIDGNGLEFGYRWPARPGTATQLRRLDVDLPRITTLMVRREAVLAVGGFDERYRTAEDIAFALDLTRIGSFVAIDEPLTAYRRHATNTTAIVPVVRQNLVHERVWRDQILAARRAGRPGEAAELRTGLSRVRDRAAREALPRSWHGLRRGDCVAAAADLWWCMTRAPGSVVRGVVSRVRGE